MTRTALPTLVPALAVLAIGLSLACGERPGAENKNQNGDGGAALCQGHAECDDPTGCLTGRCQAGRCEYRTADHDQDGAGAQCGGGTDCDDDRADVFPGAVERCASGVDEDCDGLVDCDDPDCAVDLACCTPTDESCANGEDDDCDGLVDCDDPDCNASDDCCGDWPEVCNDGADNDCDGLPDCLDPDCAGSPLCACGPEWCGDGLDNDCDGLVDCDDPDCGAALFCGGVSCDRCDGECPAPAEGVPCLDENTAMGFDLASHPSRVDRYSCGGPLFPGQELPLTFLDPQYDALSQRALVTVNVQIVPVDDHPPTDTHVFILEGASWLADPALCDPGHCITSTVDEPSQRDASVTFVAKPGVLYWIVVDRAGTELAWVNVQPLCSALCDPTETVCDDGVDDDCDGPVDCDDPDCFGSPLCP